MKKKVILLLILLIIPICVYAQPPEIPNGDMKPFDGDIPPEKPDGDMEPPDGEMPLENDMDTFDTTTYKYVKELTSNEEEKNYSSSEDGVIALILKDNEYEINNCSIDKTGKLDIEDADFYGTNAGVLVYGNAILNINKCNVKSNGMYANGVFAYGGTININNTVIETLDNHSGGIMATGGGIINANNLTITTYGDSSAAIRSDRGGGTIVVNKGVYETNGIGSPAVYSTADVTINNAKLISNASEGLILEGRNSITLNNVEVIDNNTELYLLSETYKNIFIYNSVNLGFNKEESTFTSKDSTFKTDNGDTIFVTNAITKINLENNKFINNSDSNVFLRIESAKWGREGNNGGDVILNLNKQKIEGDIILDNLSKIDINIDNKSLFIGSINNSNDAKEVNLVISKNSKISLTNDTYVNSILNGNINNSNIYSNGKYKLYVNGNEVSINNNKYISNNYIYYIVLGLILSIIIIFIIKKRNSK